MPSAGKRISEYVLDQKIGGGTFGEVWRAHHHVWVDQHVAIKIPTEPNYVRNLQREGVAATEGSLTRWPPAGKSIGSVAWRLCGGCRWRWCVLEKES